MTRPLRIAHIIASAHPGWGGPSRVIREMTAALADRGHALTVFSTDAAPGRTRAPAGAQPPFDPRVEHRVFRSDFPAPPYPSLAFTLALARALRAFDLAHVHGLFNAPSTAALQLLRRTGLPFVLRPCGMLDPWSLGQRAAPKALWWRLLDGPATLAAAAIQCSTPHELASVEAALGLVPRLLAPSGPGPRLALCPQGVGHLPVPRDPASPHPRPYLLFLGRVAEKKGLLPLVRALGLAAQPASEPGPGLAPDLIIVGPDERGHAADVRAAARAAGVEGRVHLVGPVFDPHEKARWLSHALAFALPSHDENFGITVVEAARAGLPLLVSPEVGLAPAVAEHGAGFIVPATPEAIAAALPRLLGPERGGFSEGALALGARFDWAERAADLDRLYHEVLSVRGR